MGLGLVCLKFHDVWFSFSFWMTTNMVVIIMGTFEDRKELLIRSSPGPDLGLDLKLLSGNSLGLDMGLDLKLLSFQEYHWRHLE